VLHLTKLYPHKTSIRNTNLSENKILEQLYKDPTRSDRKIAKEIDSYRQKVWRERKKLERKTVIWGYTAVVNEIKINHVIYLILFNTKPMSQELTKLFIRRIRKSEPQRQNIRIINVLYLNGEYDWLVMFSAPNHAIARRYYDSLRVVYEQYLLEKPVMVDVNFLLVREGKTNPELEKLEDFVPL
jgi:DNA-binding Lrp family transcriptional regulator